LDPAKKVAATQEKVAAVRKKVAALKISCGGLFTHFDRHIQTSLTVDDMIGDAKFC